MAEAGGRVAVVAALVGNLAVAVTKFVAAALTGSSAMLSEAVHSLVDTGNEVLLLYGMRRAKRRPDAQHPLGYGRELYFWSFIVALLLFAVGAGVSIAEGILHIRHPETIESPRIVYIVLGLSFLFEGGSWFVAWRGFARVRGDCGWWEAIKRSKNPPEFMVLLEDTAALIGILFAAAGTWAAVRFGEPAYDGAASIAIGLLLGTVSVVLARESKGLLIGERADPSIQDAVAGATREQAGVVQVNGVLATQLAPDQVAVMVSIEFDDALTTPAIEQAVAAIEARLRADRPDVHLLYIKPQTAHGYRTARAEFLDRAERPAR